MKLSVIILAGTLVVPASLVPQRASAQDTGARAAGPRTEVHAAGCARAARVLSAGGPRAEVASSHAEIAACGSQAGPALASSLRRLRSGRDTSALRQVLEATGTVRDASLFAAALEVAADRGATPEARAAGILAAALSTRPTIGFDLQALINQAQAGPCPVVAYDHTIAAARTAPLPGDASARVAAATQRLDDVSQPLLVRRAAQCAALIARTRR